MTATPARPAQPLLRELIEIPVRVDQGDFVLKLTEGVEDRARTVGQYVVTPQLRVAFDDALGLIGAALSEGLRGLKFSAALPDELARSRVRERLVDRRGASAALAEPTVRAIEP